MKSKVETFPDYRIAYIRRVGQYGAANIEVMESLKRWAKEKGLLESATLFAVSQDNPETTPSDQCRFDACIAISNNDRVDDSVLEGEISGGKYLVYEVEHTAEAIQKGYSQIFQLLQSSGYSMDNKPIMEKYVGDMISNNYCEICVPIKSS